jgi:hypothetical protein
MTGKLWFKILIHSKVKKLVPKCLCEGIFRIMQCIVCFV